MNHAATNTNGDQQTNENDHPLVDARNVSVSFGDQEVLADISLRIERGQTIAIIGESGCGKTVFMKTLVGLIKPTSGLMFFDGQCLNDSGHQELAKIRRRMGFVFQNAALFDSMSISTMSRFHCGRMRSFRITKFANEY